jgi:hypothetical protein
VCSISYKLFGQSSIANLGEPFSVYSCVAFCAKFVPFGVPFCVLFHKCFLVSLISFI